MLDLRNLRHLVMLARRLNYGRAADELGITQPTLTRSIQALERQLKIRLFDRDRGGVSITPQGRAFADRATLLLMDAEALERQTSGGERGRVRFGMAPMPAKALLARTLADRLARAPAVTNEVVVRDVEALWGMLVAGEIEFFVSPTAPAHDMSNAAIEPLGAFPLSIIVRAGHPLLTGPDEGARFPLLRSSWTGVSLPEDIHPLVLGDPNVVEDFATLASVTAQTDALWFSSVYAIEEELRAGTLRELRPSPASVEVSMYALKRRSRSPAASAVAELLRGHVMRITGRQETA